MPTLTKTIRTVAMLTTLIAGAGAAQAGDPAVLIGPLGPAAGAAAPARFVSTGLITMAFNFTKTYAACLTPLAQPGSPCSTAATPAGRTIDGLVQRSAGTCRCIKS